VLTFKLCVIEEIVWIIQNLACQIVKTLEFGAMSVNINLYQIITVWTFLALRFFTIVEKVLLALVTSHPHDTIATITFASVEITLEGVRTGFVTVTFFTSFRALPVKVRHTLVTATTGNSRTALTLTIEQVAIATSRA